MYCRNCLAEFFKYVFYTASSAATVSEDAGNEPRTIVQYYKDLDAFSWLDLFQCIIKFYKGIFFHFHQRRENLRKCKSRVLLSYSYPAFFLLIVTTSNKNF